MDLAIWKTLTLCFSSGSPFGCITSRPLRGRLIRRHREEYMPKKPTKNLAEAAPNLVAEWHPTRNDNLTPDEIGCGSAKKVWWKCGEAPV